MSNRWKWTFVWLFLVSFFCLAWWDFYQGFILVGNPPSFGSKRFVLFLLTLPLPVIFWIYWLWVIQARRFPQKIFQLSIKFVEKTNVYIRGLAAIFLIFLPAYLFLYSPLGDYQIGYWFRLAILCLCAFVVTLILFPNKFNITWLLRLAGMIMICGVIFTTADWLNDVTSYPFSLSWSEGNRMWDYSMLFGSARYINPSGKPIFTFIEKGRQFLWAIPFLIPGLNIFAFRLWNALVWILPPAILGACSVVGKPYSDKKWIWQIGFILWAYIFLSQGPIYSPLLLGAALVVIALRQKNLGIAIALVVLAAYYLRISRWTWMYAPGLWAGMIALLAEEQPSFTSTGWKKLIRPVILGISGYIGAEYLLPLISSVTGRVSQTASSVISDQISILGIQTLLWDRLLPNPTYAPGILLGTAWVGLPVMLFIFWVWKVKIWKPNWLQSLSVVFLCSLFMGLGFLASVKIGGGSNLHNLDMLWVTLAIITGWIWKKWMDNGFPLLFQKKGLIVILSLAIAFPATSLIQYGEPLRLPPDNLVQNALSNIQTKVAEAQKKGQVLFIDQRQLITFGYIQNLPLTVEYEKKYLMEQAMSGNISYLDQFQTQLEKKKYSLIISIPISDLQADERLKNFAEENNAWVEWVSQPLIKYYKPLVTMERVGVQLLIPR